MLVRFFEVFIGFMVVFMGGRGMFLGVVGLFGLLCVLEIVGGLLMVGGEEGFGVGGVGCVRLEVRKRFGG